MITLIGSIFVFVILTIIGYYLKRSDKQETIESQIEAKKHIEENDYHLALIELKNAYLLSLEDTNKSNEILMEIDMVLKSCEISFDVSKMMKLRSMYLSAIQNSGAANSGSRLGEEILGKIIHIIDESLDKVLLLYQK